MSEAPLLPLAEARADVMAAAPPPPPRESVALGAACGRVLALGQSAVLDVPPWDNSAMDGYAVRASAAGGALPVAQTVAAGDPPGTLATGTAARIFTGAPVPAGADAVVLQEDCRREGDTVQLPAEVNCGQHIRRRGQDTRSGDRLLPAGRVLRPQDIGLLASQGLAAVDVYRPLTVALLCTGSELRDPGDGALGPGEIYNSNRPMLTALLSALGCAIRDLGIVPDDPAATAAALTEAATADVILSSGGVSVGEADHVREQVARLGAIDVWRLAIKPGKPFAFGRVGSTPFLGLPGNPVSAFVTFALLARPFLCAAQGRSEASELRHPGRAAFAVTRPGTREEYLRVSVERRGDELWALPFGNQSSGVLSSVCASTALAVVPAGSVIAEGDAVELLHLDALVR